jgi:ribonuclease P/MRP protein subunit RPP20
MNMKTICRWLVMTEFELFLNLLGFFVFTVLLCIKLDTGGNNLAFNLIDFEHTQLTWFKVFLPLFLVDILQLNFCTIVFIRQLHENLKRDALLHFIISCLFLLSRIAFKILLFIFITKTIEINAKLIMSPKFSHFNFGGGSGGSNLNQFNLAFKFSFVASPLFFHLNLLLFRSCSLKKYQAYF